MFVTLIDTRLVTSWRLLVRPIIKSSNFRCNFRKEKNGRKLVRAITAESIYRCMLLFLDHFLYHRAHFVRDALRASRAVLAITYPLTPELTFHSWDTPNFHNINLQTVQNQRPTNYIGTFIRIFLLYNVYNMLCFCTIQRGFSSLPLPRSEVFRYWLFQGGSSVAVLCSCVGSFICDACFVIVFPHLSFFWCLLRRLYFVILT